jgi:hypothetical protein
VRGCASEARGRGGLPRASLANTLSLSRGLSGVIRALSLSLSLSLSLCCACACACVPHCLPVFFLNPNTVFHALVI